MAVLLVMNRTDLPPNGGWARGDVIDIKDDGEPWGTQEGPPTFKRVRVPGVPKATLAYLLEEWVEGEDEELRHHRTQGFSNIDSIAHDRSFNLGQLTSRLRRKPGA